MVAYISGYGPAIAWFDVDLATGALTEKGSLAAPQPSYLALAAGHAYAVSENLNRVAAYAIAIASDGSVTLASHTPSGGTTPRMFALDPTGRWLFAANQGSDTVVAFAIDATAVH
ncbi:MAG: beta-propeller fold lactonase family protein [Deltaproteobacteria bacterium]